MKFSGRILSLTAVLAAVVSPATRASFHLIEINEVYSNADGSVQYVELKARKASQTNLSPTRVVALNADRTVTTVVFDFTASFPALDSGETILIATPGFQAVAGFAPDFVMSACSVISAPDGRVTFQNDAGTFIVDSVTYTALPTNGSQALLRVASQVYVIGSSSPKRNDGTTTTLSPAVGRDCNANHKVDVCEIAAGTADDDNDNRILDECEGRGDFDGDGDVGLDDYRLLHDCLDSPDGGILPGCDVQDLTGDEAVDLADIAPFQNAFGTPP